MKNFIFCLLISIATNAWCAPTAAPWTAYFGSHYESAPWGLSMRDPGGPGRFGYWLPSAQTEKRMTTADSGSLEELSRPIAQGDVVLNVGGLGSGRDLGMVKDFLDEVRRDKGATWKKELSNRVRRVAKLPGATERVFWQFGNEINGPRFLRNMADWGGVNKRDKAEAMRQIIPVYVEYFLAPGVEAIRNTSRELHGDPERIHVMLGSLAGARNPNSIRWYEQLMEYTIKGDNAKSLAGRKVYEIVDSLSIHYLVTAQDDGWTEIMDNLAKKWVGRGAIRRIWSTEEIGVRRAQSGKGASTALRVTARYLDWWLKQGWSPNQGHCFFWGAEMGEAGTRANDALRTLVEFTGQTALARQPGAEVGELENYLFSVAGERKRVLIAFPKEKSARGEDQGARGDDQGERRQRRSEISDSSEGGVFNGGTIPASGWSGTLKVRLLQYTTQGVATISAPTVTQTNSGYRISPRSPIEMPAGSALLMLIERE